MAIQLRRLKLNAKIAALLQAKEHFIENKKKIVAFHLNNNPFWELVGAKSFND
jgi:hypothetical protein